MKKIYLKDIAKDLNISKTTVSLVLNNKGDENKISQHTQEKILKYAKDHNYVPNQLARGLSRGKSETIGLIIPDISNTFFASIAGHIEKKAKSSGYIVIFSSSYEDATKEKELIQSMLHRQVEGLIIASTQQNQKEIEALKKDKIPFVLIDRYYPECDTNYVMVDNFNGTKRAAEHLLQLGRKKLGFVTLQSNIEVIKQRKEGFKKALVDFGIEPKNELIKEIDIDNYESETKGAIESLLSPSNAVDAIIFSTHYLATAGLRELKRLNIQIPDEVAIISFDDLSAFDLVDPPITSIAQPTTSIGDHAFDVLLDKINNRKSNDGYIKKILRTKLKVRRSCGSM